VFPFKHGETRKAGKKTPPTLNVIKSDPVALQLRDDAASKHLSFSCNYFLIYARLIHAISVSRV
jgi:hypothetical protein